MSREFMFLMMSIFIKLFCWMQMDKNAIRREIKRSKAQISSIANKQPLNCEIYLRNTTIIY
jgi:hypothetical protein